MELIQAIVYGVLQGLTEFLPISSSAHIRIAPVLLGWSDPGAAFTANIQLGTLVAVLLYFRSDLNRALVGWWRGVRQPEQRSTEDFKLGMAILVGSIPIIVLGVLLKDLIEEQFRSLYVVSGMLIFMALLLGLAEWKGKRNRSLGDVRPLDGLWVGLWQAIALIPGASRSGSTITGAMFLGFDRATAARFSFLLSVPSIFLAAVYTAYQSRAELSGIVGPLVTANVASFVVGYACIAFLIRFLQTNTNLVFIVYRIVLGLTILGLIFGGQLTEFAGIR